VITAVGLLRVSTEDQQLGPEVQRAAIERWATANGATIVAWHSDVGVSGAAPIEKRPGLLAALADVRALKASVLVVQKRDRLARDTMIAAMIERVAEKAGARVECADGVGNGASPEAQMIRGLMDVFAMYERGVIKSRTKAALAAKRARGEATGGASPYGYTIDAGRLVPSDTEAEAVARARELRREGMALRTIGAMLTSEGFRPRTGTTWHPTTLARIVGRVA